MRNCTLALFFAIFCRANDLTVIASVTSSVVAPGGTAQMIVTLASPVNITQGRLKVDLDAGVFGSITAVQVFSASGDQQGAAQLQGLHAEVLFGAESGNIGVIPGFPILQITASVLPSAPMGTVGAVTLTANSMWREASGDRYAVTFESPGVTVGPGMSIQRIDPGGGQLAAGTVVTISGQGFTPSTVLQLDGVPWKDFEVVSPEQATVTLAGATDLTGKLFQLSDAGGLSTRYYSALIPTVIDDADPPSGMWPIFSTWKVTGVSDNPGYSVWLLNDTSDSIDVSLTGRYPICTPCHFPPGPSRSVTVPARSVRLVNFGGGSLESVGISASAPIHHMRGLPLFLAPLPDVRPSFFTGGGTSPAASTVLDYRIGDPPPTLSVSTFAEKVESVVVGTDDGTGWLSAAPSGTGTPNLKLSIDPTTLAIGSHLGVATAKVSGAGRGFVQFPVKLMVHRDMTIAVDQSRVSLSATFSSTVSITSSSPSVPISVTAADSWVLYSLNSSTTPARLRLSLAPSPPFVGRSSISIGGPGNAIVIPVIIGPDFGLVTLGVPEGGQPVETVAYTYYLNFNFSISGGNWLTAVAAKVNSNWVLTIRADPTGLPPGSYVGNIRVVSSGNAPVSIPVLLSVWSKGPAGFAVEPAFLNLPGHDPILTVLTPGAELPVAAKVQSSPDLSLSVAPQGITPMDVYVGAYSSFPGTRHGTVTLTAPPGSSNSITIPISVTEPAAIVVDSMVPRISSIVDLTGLTRVVPGQKVSIYGLVACPAPVDTRWFATPTTQSLGIRVLFNGIPGQLVYVSSTRIDVIVPDGITGSSSADIVIDGSGILSETWTVPVA